MSTKLQHSYAQLSKLKLQIRVQLNKCRPSREIYNYEKPNRSAKRIFYKKYELTSLNDGSQESAVLGRNNSRRHFQDRSMVHVEYGKSCEKKHYERHYTDRVTIMAPVQRKNSAYLNVRATTPTRSEYGNSLLGIGVLDKSNKQIRSGKKTYSQKLAWKECHLK